MAKGEWSLLCKLALMVGFKRTIHYALIGSKLLWSHFLSRHILLCWHVLEGSCNQTITLPTTVSVLSLEKVVDQSGFVTCHCWVINYSWEGRLAASSDVMSIVGWCCSATFLIIGCEFTLESLCLVFLWVLQWKFERFVNFLSWHKVFYLLAESSFMAFWFLLFISHCCLCLRICLVSCEER